MIKQSILNEFKSSNSNPEYSILISNIEPDTSCNQESIILTVHKVNIAPSAIEADATKVIEKKIEIISDLGYDSNGSPFSKINGYAKRSKVINPTVEEDGISSHSIEMIQAPLQEIINIEFSKQYLEEPGIIINIDKQYESLYRSTSTNYLKKIVEKDGINTEVCYGVDITFNSLKRRGKYPNIKIIIIGDKIDQQNPSS